MSSHGSTGGPGRRAPGGATGTVSGPARGTRVGPARGAQVGAWLLVLAVLVSWVLAGLAVWAGAAPSAGGSSTATSLTATAPGPAGAEQVVLVGIPGLTWDLVQDESTPTLARMARQGGAAALVARGTHEVTCAADAWLTVGAGQRAATDLAGCGDAPQDGSGAADGDGSGAATTADGAAPVVTAQGVDEAAWGRWQQAADRRGLAPRLGSLAALAEQGGTCVAAYGAGAALGAARPDGSVAVGVPAEPGSVPAGVVEGVGRAAVDDRVCRIHLVSGPSLAEGDRAVLLPEVDAALAELVGGVPEGTTVLVAGLGHVNGRAEAQVLLAAPLEMRDGAGASLSSGSTRQRSLVQLTDLTPTLLGLAGVDPEAGPVAEGPEAGSTAEDLEAGPAAGGPEASPAAAAEDLAGQPVTATPQVGDHVAQAQDLALGVSVAKWQAPWVLGALFAVVLPVLGVALLMQKRAARRRPSGSRPLLAVAGTLALATPAACFLAGLVPWWRAGQPWPAAVALILLGAALVTGLAWAGPWRRHTLGPAAVVAAVTLVVLGVDVIWSARLGLVSVLGLQPVTAGRFFGQGNVGFGIFLGSVLVLFGALVSWLRGWSAALAVGALGAGATVLNAAPQGGADFGGVPALAVATGLVLLAAVGLRWTPTTLLAVAVGGVVVAAGALVLDWLRGPGSRTHLGDFVQSVLDGEGGGVVARKLDQSLGILVSYPVSWLAVLALLLVGWAVVGRPAWSAPLWVHRGLQPVAVAALVALALAWALNDSGIAAVALALTVLIAAALTVLGRERPSP